MTEARETPVEYVAFGRPEAVATSETHPALNAVKGAISRWWERVGPGSVENAWVTAHKNILKHIGGEERQRAFAKSEQSWRRIGKAFGYASTVLDVSIGGLGLVLAVRGWRQPQQAEGVLNNILHFVGTRHNRLAFIYNWYHHFLPRDDSLTGEALVQIRPRREAAGRGASAVAGLGAVGILGGFGPAHAVSRFTAGMAEKIGAVGAHTGNYVASGKAAEHAKKVGGALGKGAEATLKYAAEHPEDIRKTIKTVEEIRKERERGRVAEEVRRKREAEAQLQREYDMWVAAMSVSLRSYYELNKQWPPPMADFLKERDAFLASIAQGKKNV